MALMVQKKIISIFTLAIWSASTPSFAVDLAINGDGSATNNQNLLRGSFETGCYYPAICGGLLIDIETAGTTELKTQPVTNSQDPLHNNIRPANLALRANIAPIELAPAFNNIPYFESNTFSPATKFDWSVSLRGAYRKDYNGKRFETIVTPKADVSHQNKNAIYNLGIEASLVKPSDSEISLSNASTKLDGIIKIDKETDFTFDSNAQISQENKNSLAIASNIITPPSILNINANAALLRRFGKLTSELRAGYKRNFYSNTGMNDGSWQDNSVQNRNAYSAGLRLTQEITPIISAYVDLQAERNIYDIAPPTPNVIRNNWDFAARGGLSGNWGNILLADISAGYAYRKYDSATLDDSPTIIVDANVSYNMGQGLDVFANFASDISTPEPTSGATKRIGYSLSATANYQINDWLSATASASGAWASFEGIGDIERTYSAGIGLDYALNRHTKLSGNYIYSLSEPTPADRRDSHRVEIGVTYSR